MILISFRLLCLYKIVLILILIVIVHWERKIFIILLGSLLNFFSNSRLYSFVLVQISTLSLLFNNWSRLFLFNNDKQIALINCRRLCEI
jgi:uncharacterized membrane protein YesL